MIATFKKIGLLILATLAFYACSLKQMVKLAEQQELTVTPSPLELHGDSVKFEVSAVLPVKLLKKNKIYTIKTKYAYGDPTQELDQFEFSDVEFPNQKIEQPNKKQSFSMFYEDAMETGELKIKGVASNLAKTKYKETEELKIADGVITTSRSVAYAYDISLADHGYNNKEELIPTNVSFQFKKGSAKLTSSEVKGNSGQELNAFIAAKNVTRTVTITGSHSPEGLESVNSKLAEDRAKVIKNFYYSKMKSYDYKNLADSIKFETIAIFQKWDQFLSLVDANSSLSDENKGDIKSIVSGSGSYRDKEKTLSKKSYYNTLTSEVYPTLRYSKTRILSVKKKKTNAEINILANSIIKGTAKIDTLSNEELMYAATLTPLSDEKKAIYKAVADKHATWQAHNNLAAIYLQDAKKATNATAKKAIVEKAKAQSEIAVNKDANAITLNNLAATQLLLGDRKTAMSTYERAANASGANSEVLKGLNAGRGSIEVRNGNYNRAITLLKGANDNNDEALYNLGLAYLLSKDYSNAQQALEAAIYVNKKNALAHYANAIVGARKGNETLIVNNLKEAVKLDGNLRDKAIKDLEFKKYWENAQFIESLK